MINEVTHTPCPGSTSRSLITASPPCASCAGRSPRARPDTGDSGSCHIAHVEFSEYIELSGGADVSGALMTELGVQIVEEGTE